MTRPTCKRRTCGAYAQGALLLSVVLWCGCTAVREIRVESTPQPSELYHDGRYAGDTPVTFKLHFEQNNDHWSTHQLKLLHDGYEPFEKQISINELPQKTHVNPKHFVLEPLTISHEITVEVSPSDAVVTLDGRELGQGSMKIALSFERRSSTTPWSTHDLTIRAADFMEEHRLLTEDFCEHNDRLPVELGRIRQVLPLTVTSNIDDSEVRVANSVVGHTPCSVDLEFTRRTPEQEWAAISIGVKKEGYVNIIPLPNGRYEQFDSYTDSLRPQEVIDSPQLAVVLEKRRWQELTVPVWEIGDLGPVFGRKTVRSYLEDIEKEPKVKSVSRITSYHPRELVASKLDVLPDSESIIYIVPHEVPDKEGRGRAGELSNLWSTVASEVATTRHTDGGYIDLHPAVTDAGDFFYFLSSRLRVPTIWRVSVEGKLGLTKITDGSAMDEWPVISSDNSKLAFVSRLRPGAAPHIWVANADGTLPTQLREGTMPDWSPDGKHIAYVAPDPTTQNNKLWVMGQAGSHPTQITLLPESDEQCPSWHPDGERIVFSSNRARDELGDPNYDIWITSRDGTQTTQLTVNGSDDMYPSVSPNGKYVYFYSYRGARTEIWRLELP